MFNIVFSDVDSQINMWPAEHIPYFEVIVITPRISLWPCLRANVKVIHHPVTNIQIEMRVVYAKTSFLSTQILRLIQRVKVFCILSVSCVFHCEYRNMVSSFTQLARLLMTRQVENYVGLIEWNGQTKLQDSVKCHILHSVCIATYFVYQFMH